MDDRARAILDFWFGVDEANVPVARWFAKDPAFDAEIRARFGADYERACRGELGAWADSGEPKAALALVILLDQFSRNLNRDSSSAFDQDERALAITERTLPRAASLTFLERYVLLLPTMHAEELGAQRRGVAAYAALLSEAEAAGAPEAVLAPLRSAHEYAVKHEEIVARFGRFPHRNGVLGRTPTPDESEFLLGPGSSF